MLYLDPVEPYIPREDLRQRLVRAGFWSFALHTLQSAAVFLRIVILAMLLPPEEFGLFGITMLTFILLETFTKTGFHEALVQKDQDVSSHLDAAWTVLALRGLMLALLTLVLAPVISSFFNSPEATTLLRVTALAFVFLGMRNIGVLAFLRELKFHKEFIYRSIASLTDLTVAIAVGIALRSAWALVLGFLAGCFVQLVLSYAVHPYRPRIRFSLKKSQDLFRFGSWILFIGAVTFAGMHGSAVVVGKVLGTAALGLFQVARRIPEMTVDKITVTLGEVSFPAYAQIQNSREDLREAYGRIAGVSAALTFPAAVGIAVTGSVFVAAFLGRQWEPMIPALVILSLASLVRSAAFTGRSFFLGGGKPYLAFQMQAMRAMVLIVSVYPLTLRWGIAGAASSMLLGNLGMAAVWHMKIRSRFGLAGRDLAVVFGLPAAASSAMAAGILVLKATLLTHPSTREMSHALLFLLLVGSGMVSYCVCLFLCTRFVHSYRPFKGFVSSLKG